MPQMMPIYWMVIFLFIVFSLSFLLSVEWWEYYIFQKQSIKIELSKIRFFIK